jgi:hypothetical protein
VAVTVSSFSQASGHFSLDIKVSIYLMSRWLQAVGSWFWLCMGGDEVVAEIQGPCARAWPPCPKVEILHEEEIPVKETEIPTYLNVLYLTLPCKKVRRFAERALRPLDLITQVNKFYPEFLITTPRLYPSRTSDILIMYPHLILPRLRS